MPLDRIKESRKYIIKTLYGLNALIKTEWISNKSEFKTLINDLVQLFFDKTNYNAEFKWGD